jgi:PhnB protein
MSFSMDLAKLVAGQLSRFVTLNRRRSGRTRTPCFFSFPIRPDHLSRRQPMSVRPIPEGYHTITPNIIVQGVDKAIEFYKRAFGAEEKVRLTMPNGTIVHCELIIGDSRLNLGEPMEGWPAHLLLAQLHVEDSDAIFQQAIDAGAEAVMPMTDMFFGSREGRVVDPFGNTWTISSRKEIVSPEEMQRRLNTFAS